MSEILTKVKGKKKMANEQVLNLLPSKLTVVTKAMVTENETLKPYEDMRAEWKVDDALKTSIGEKGIITPVLAVKDTKNKQVIIIDGKQRVKAAQELESEGQSIFVPVIVRDYDEGMIASVRVISNNIRQDNDFITNLTEAKKLKEVFNFSYEQIGNIFGKTHQTIRDWLVIDEMPSQVKTAVQKGMIGSTAAAKLAKGNKAEDGTYNKEAIVGQLQALASEAKATGEKKIKVSNVAKKDGDDRPSNSQLRILAAMEETPEEFRFFFRYLTKEIDLKTMKSIARGKLDWFSLPKVTKEDKKKAKANNQATKKAEKAAKKAKTEITNEDLQELFG